MIFERFDILVIPFPFSDVAKAKPRPAVILSERDFNRANGHSLVGMITRGTVTRWPSDYSIRDLVPTGLPVPSVVRFKLFTLDNSILQRPIGRLADTDSRAVLTSLRAMIGT